LIGSNLGSVLVGAAIGGSFTLAGSVVVHRWEITQQVRQRLHDEVLSPLVGVTDPSVFFRRFPNTDEALRILRRLEPYLSLHEQRSVAALFDAIEAYRIEAEAAATPDEYNSPVYPDLPSGREVIDRRDELDIAITKKLRGWRKRVIRRARSSP